MLTSALAAIGGTAFGVGAYFFLKGDCDLSARVARVPHGFYRDKIIWVTGASSGIGRAICLQLASYGSHLIVSARNRDALQELALELRARGAASVHIVPVDLSEGASAVSDAVHAAYVAHGRLDVLVNNAGIGTRAAAMHLDLDAVHKLMEVNFFAPIHCARLCAQSSAGVRMIINTSSLASTIAVPLRSSYSASKAALERWFDSFRLEHPEIHVLSLCPGRTVSNFSRNALTPGGGAYGKMDPSTANGLSPQRVADRALAAAACGINCAWVAVPKELFAIRLATYFPGLWSLVVSKMFSGKVNV